jgi:hypothetical protein
MGETLAETRLEVEARRAELDRTATLLRERARRAFDIRAKIRENPVLFGGLAAGAVFLVVGGPVRLVKAARRRIAPTRPEQAYDALPATLQSWVDVAAEALGPKAEDARKTLAEELQRWRREPANKKQARALAKELAEGPPGPRRTAWKAFEAAATLISAALARRAIERFLSGDQPMDAAAELSPAHPSENGPGSGAAGAPASRSGTEYTGWSGRSKPGPAGGDTGR